MPGASTEEQVEHVGFAVKRFTADFTATSLLLGKIESVNPMRWLLTIMNVH